MSLQEQLIQTMNKVKDNTSLLGYIISKYLLEIVACLVTVLSYIAMFISYGLMSCSNKIYVFINITYDDFEEYKLETFVSTAIKSFYTKFPKMKKYFVVPKIKKEKPLYVNSSTELIDLTQSDSDSDSETKQNKTKKKEKKTD